MAFGFLKDIYVINLDRRSDRMESIDVQLKALKLDYHRFSAVDGIKLRDQCEKGEIFSVANWHKDVKFNTDDLEKRMMEENDGQWGRFGCWQSHLQVMLRIVDEAKRSNDDGPVLILEDDVIIDADMPFLVKQAADTLPSNWEYFAIGHLFATCVEQVSSFVCRTDHSMGGQGYILRNAAAAQKLIEWSNTNEFQIADMYWLSHMEEGELQAYIITPRSIIEQDRERFGSDIPFSASIPMPNVRLVAGRHRGKVMPESHDWTNVSHDEPDDEVAPQANSSLKVAVEFNWTALIAIWLLISY